MELTQALYVLDSPPPVLECKGVVDSWPFVRRETCFAPGREN